MSAEPAPRAPFSLRYGFRGQGGIRKTSIASRCGRGVSFVRVQLSFFRNIFSRMKKSGHPPHLTIVEPGATGSQPSRPLGVHGRALWGKVTAEYDISDAAGVEMLTQACQAVDLAEALSARIAEDGEIVRTPTGIKSHPAIKDGLTARAFVVRTLQKLGLNFEPLRAGPGRPAGS
jgi:hypothetical protein